jgi:hypothetical protein
MGQDRTGQDRKGSGKSDPATEGVVDERGAPPRPRPTPRRPPLPPPPRLPGPRFGRLTIAYIFSPATMHGGSHIGRLVIATHALNAAAAATHLMWIVERAKKCLDFASTCYLWHLVFCSAYGGFPTTLTWCAAAAAAAPEGAVGSAPGGRGVAAVGAPRRGAPSARRTAAGGAGAHGRGLWLGLATWPRAPLTPAPRPPRGPGHLSSPLAPCQRPRPPPGALPHAPTLRSPRGPQTPGGASMWAASS